MLNKSSIPLVRLNLILPFVEELDRRSLSTDSVLAESGLVRGTVLDDSVFVPPIVINRFLEDAAVAADDPHLAARVGESLDWSGWPPMVEAASKARNLVGFLVRFIRAASSEASSARHELDIGAEYSVFSEKRTTDQEIVPAQNDAFTAAYTLGLLRRAAGPVWDSEQVRLTVCDASALPRRYMGVHIIEGDRLGIMVRFPSAWLVESFDRETFLISNGNGDDTDDLPKQFLDALRHVIAPHLHETELGLGTVAAWVGTSPQSLQRKLRAAGTTLTAVTRDLKKGKAVEFLLRTNRSISDIASALGFDNPTSFTRAFKSWTGLPPREYRKQHRDH
jgi:AraC-like DNA-binding protein